MKIPGNFERLKNEESLIIVAGKQAAVIYEIEKGLIERIDAFKIPRPKYSDNEGHFRTGASHEFKDEDVIKEFLREFKRRIKKLDKKYESVYVLAPDKTKNRIPQSLTDELKRKLKKVVNGNFYYRSPVFILEKIENTPKEEYKGGLKKGKKKRSVK